LVAQVDALKRQLEAATKFETDLNEAKDAIKQLTAELQQTNRDKLATAKALTDLKADVSFRVRNLQLLVLRTRCDPASSLAVLESCE
jgi:septal ring factor EnvC (AmiA/AmiB activator)